MTVWQLGRIVRRWLLDEGLSYRILDPYTIFVPGEGFLVKLEVRQREKKGSNRLKYGGRDILSHRERSDELRILQIISPADSNEIYGEWLDHLPGIAEYNLDNYKKGEVAIKARICI